MTELEDALDRYRRLRDGFVWNVPEDFNFARDVVDRFAADPDRPATLYRDAAGGETRITYAQMSDAIHRCAGLYEALGLAPGERVIVILPRIPEWQIATVGALAAGLVAIPTSMAVLGPSDIAHRVRHSGAAVVVATPGVAAHIDALRIELPSLRHFLLVEEEGAARPGWTGFRTALAQATPTPGRPTRASDPALVFYTSGTTGRPKAVLHNHCYTYTGTRQASIWHGIRPHDRFWPTTGWAKAAFGPWSVGAEMVIVDRAFDTAEQIALIEALEPDVFCAPPTQYRLLVKHGIAGLRVPRLRECVAAGEPLNPEVIRAWKAETGITIRDGYGQSEAGLLIANLAGMPERPGSMGLPLPGYHVAIIDAEGHELDPGETGDIAVRYPAPGLFLRYWQDEEATARTRRGDWYLTGDRGWRDRDGYFWFVGRSDDVIISGSHRIGPFEVESLLVEHPAVMEAAAVAQPDEMLGQSIRAFVVLRPGYAACDALVTELRRRFDTDADRHKMPASFHFVETLPKTATGKIRRAELRTAAE
ncbi:acyl-CoA synthetase [Flavisphingomonas formosensis]|uniref:acyl-CoA synthetase n=1 Tax=Flavisphingomonas formosensis TaxID=861534 RepID=UPI0012F88B20|nr:AMP-binding protein [Sphingomonas formosensis]